MADVAQHLHRGRAHVDDFLSRLINRTWSPEQEEPIPA
jgi:hypothetical protein